MLVDRRLLRSDRNQLHLVELVLARLLYGFRVSVLFALALTAIGSLLGILAGAVQGY